MTELSVTSRKVLDRLIGRQEAAEFRYLQGV